MRLIYIGRLLADFPAASEASNPRMWNLVLPGHPQHQSTLALETLHALGLIKGAH